MTLQRYLLLISIVIFSTGFSNAQKQSKKTYLADSLSANYMSPLQNPLTDSIINYGKMFLNTRYRGGGSSSSTGFDCSGFTSFVYKNFGFNLKRSSSDQANQFDAIDRSGLRTGDLVFFSGRRKSKKHVGHVGIVVAASPEGKFEFIHSANGGGVIVSNSEEPYYLQRYIKAGRVISDERLLAAVPLLDKTTQKQSVETSVTNPTYSEILPTAPIKKTIKKTIPAEYHSVKKGETLSSIALKFGMSIAELKRKNNIKSDKISLKQRIKVKDSETILLAQTVQPTEKKELLIADNQSKTEPAKQETDLANNDSKPEHIVQKGETLYGISNLYHITVDQLTKLNNLIKGKIMVGQKLKLEQLTQSTSRKYKEVTPEIAKTEPQPIPKPEVSKPVDSEPKVTSHKVESGETLFSIAKKYDTSVDELKEINNLSDGKIKVGQKLKLDQTAQSTSKKSKEVTPEIAKTELQPELKPEVSKPATTEPKTTSHKVESGESLYSIAKKFDISVDELKKINKLNESKIKPGQTLKLVETAEEKPSPKTAITKAEKVPKLVHYKAKSGDSFYSIAKEYGCKVDQLKEWNKKSGSKIKIGEKFIIYQ